MKSRPINAINVQYLEPLTYIRRKIFASRSYKTDIFLPKLRIWILGNRYWFKDKSPILCIAFIDSADYDRVIVKDYIGRVQPNPADRWAPALIICATIVPEKS